MKNHNEVNKNSKSVKPPLLSNKYAQNSYMELSDIAQLIETPSEIVIEFIEVLLRIISEPSGISSEIESSLIKNDIYSSETDLFVKAVFSIDINSSETYNID